MSRPSDSSLPICLISTALCTWLISPTSRTWLSVAPGSVSRQCTKRTSAFSAGSFSRPLRWAASVSPVFSGFIYFPIFGFHPFTKTRFFFFALVADSSASTQSFCIPSLSFQLSNFSLETSFFFFKSPLPQFSAFGSQQLTPCLES